MLPSLIYKIYDFTNESILNLINEQLIPYIEDCPCTEEEKYNYYKELNEVVDNYNWRKLIESEVYHDAIGEVYSYKLTEKIIIVGVLIYK